jgi:hypothetical protein
MVTSPKEIAESSRASSLEVSCEKAGWMSAQALVMAASLLKRAENPDPGFQLSRGRDS